MKKTLAAIAGLLCILACSRPEINTPRAPEASIPEYAAFTDGLLPDITPEGWIKTFLERQRSGITGHPEALSYPYNSCLWDGEIIRNTETYGSDIIWEKLPEIHPIVLEYNGGDIEQAPGRYIKVDSAEGVDLPGLVGSTIIHTDGTTVLGGDDKNGCAIVMSLLKTVLQEGVKHGRIQIVIAPNEDIGHAALQIDTLFFNPDILFDVDGAGGNQIMASNFTARGVNVEFIGHDA